jgi:hypothetical protein
MASRALLFFTAANASSKLAQGRVVIEENAARQARSE